MLSQSLLSVPPWDETGVELHGLRYLEGKSEGLARSSGKFSLDSIRCLLAYLGNPETHVPMVHIGGTNGKGSVAASVAAIAGAAGLKVGLTTSPHLHSVTERVVVDGEPVSPERLNHAVLYVLRACRKLGLELSYFEHLIASAFLLFAEEGVELGVVEVGLGGRLDATNVIPRPEAVGIVSVGLDHMEVLGSTVELIAAEKSRIIKPGVPAVVGEMDACALQVMESYAHSLGAPLYRFGREFSSRLLQSGCVDYRSSSLMVGGITLGLEGPHQGRNAGMSIKLAELLGFDTQAIESGLRGVFWPGRFERYTFGGRPVIFDCAHNPPGIVALSETLTTLHVGPVDIVFAALSNRDWRSMVEVLRPHVREWCIVEAETEKAVPAPVIGDYLSGVGVKVRTLGADMSGAAEWITREPSGVPVLVTGSMYMVGPFRSLLGVPDKRLWSRAGSSKIHT